MDPISIYLIEHDYTSQGMGLLFIHCCNSFCGFVGWNDVNVWCDSSVIWVGDGRVDDLGDIGRMTSSKPCHFNDALMNKNIFMVFWGTYEQSIITTNERILSFKEVS